MHPSCKPNQEGDCCQLPFKTIEEDNEEWQEMTASLAATEKITTDAAVAAVPSELGDLF